MLQSSNFWTACLETTSSLSSAFFWSCRVSAKVGINWSGWWRDHSRAWVLVNWLSMTIRKQRHISNNSRSFLHDISILPPKNHLQTSWWEIWTKGETIERSKYVLYILYNYFLSPFPFPFSRFHFVRSRLSSFRQFITLLKLNFEHHKRTSFITTDPTFLAQLFKPRKGLQKHPLPILSSCSSTASFRHRELGIRSRDDRVFETQGLWSEWAFWRGERRFHRRRY